jgi:PAS domain S-box-containing protein
MSKSGLTNACVSRLAIPPKNMETKLTRVLQVVHDPTESELISVLLANSLKLPITVESVGRLDAALELLATGDIDIVLLNLSLPDSHGLASFTRVHERVPEVPIIVVSDRYDEAVALDVVRGGAEDYLVTDRMDGHVLVRAVHHAIERKRAADALARERNLLRSLIDHVPDPIYIKDAEGRYVLNNPAHNEVIGSPAPESLFGRTALEFFPPEQAMELHTNDLEVIRSGKPTHNREESLRDLAGRNRWHLTTKVPLRDAHDRIVGLVCIARDITAQRQAEKQLGEVNTSLHQSEEELKSANLQLMHSERLQSLGRLAAGIAHEVKNPLAVLSMGVDFYADQPGLSSGEAERTVLEEMRSAIQRANTIIMGLLEFSMPGALILMPADVSHVVETSLTFLRHEMTSGAFLVEREFTSTLPPVHVDRPKIEQVLIVLITNALHAMPKGGTITVRTDARKVGGDDGSREVIVIEVDDSGHGIPEDKIPRLFEPFFTTKEAGKGTGLGLTVARKIVELHDGTLEIKNRPEGGVRATVTFPLEKQVR